MSIYPDTLTTCSACLCITNSPVETFDSYTMNAYREVTGFEALSEHSLCYICRALVHKFFKFRRKCRQSYGELSRLQDYKYFKEIRNEFESHTGLLSNSTLQTLSTDEIDEEAPVLDSSRFLEKTTGIWCKNVLRIKEEIKDCIETEDIKMEQFDNVNDDFVCDEIKIDADFNDYSPMCVIPDLINPTKAKSKSKKRTKRKKLNGRRERDAKRRGRGDADEDGTLDELNMRLVTLSHDEQLAEIEDKKTSEAYSASEFKCGKCGSFFTYEGSFDSHTIRHDEAYGAHECPVCLVRFPSVRTLWSHRSNHRRRFECTACGRRIAQRRDCALHRAVCQKQPPPTAVAEKLTCDVCGKQSSSEYALKRHRSRSHFGEKKHQCHLCQKAFFNIQALRDHIVVHSGARPYVCENCGSGFPTRSRLQQHLVTHIASKHFYCAACDMTFPTERRLSTHLKVGAKHIKPEMLRHACDTCSRRFFTARALQLHVDRVHLKVQRYVCSECDRCYAAPNALILHLRKEHPESAPARKRPLLPERRRYVCDFCGDSFASRTILTCHMRRHTGERPLECPHCEARFAYPSARYTHIRLVHLKLKRNKTRKNPTATTRSDDAPSKDCNVAFEGLPL